LLDEGGDMAGSLRRVCVYCASSRQAHPEFAEDARRLGRILAERGVTIVYGGGAIGSMGALADGALAARGRVIGVLPQFMYDLEWGHRGLTELRVVNDIHERKRMMIQEVDAVVALPGGSGTFEELLEAITWKRLGLYVNPIVIVNGRGYYDPLLTLLGSAVRERFMDERHRAMWSVVDRAEDVVRAIESAPPWSADARSFATS
jgi:uncharacterized protein (TIGR00730 family)